MCVKELIILPKFSLINNDKQEFKTEGRIITLNFSYNFVIIGSYVDKYKFFTASDDANVHNKLCKYGRFCHIMNKKKCNLLHSVSVPYKLQFRISCMKKKDCGLCRICMAIKGSIREFEHRYIST